MVTINWEYCLYFLVLWFSGKYEIYYEIKTITLRPDLTVVIALVAYFKFKFYFKVSQIQGETKCVELQV